MQINQKTKNMLVILAVVLGFLTFAILIFLPKGDGDKEADKPGVSMVIPDPLTSSASLTKGDSYRQSSAAADDYWDSLGGAEGEGTQPASPESRGTSEPKGDGKGLSRVGIDGPPQAPSAQDLIGEYMRQQEAREQAEARAAASEQAVHAPQTGRQQSAPVAYPQEPQQPREESSQESGGQQRETVTQAPKVKRSGVITGLDEGDEEDLGSGFMSLSQESYIEHDSNHPYKCVFFRPERLRNGQRVAVRLMEDLVVGNVIIPKNSLLQATCTIGDRIRLRITSMEYNGKILSMNYSAYDSDGAEGIYCSELSQAAKMAEQQGISQAGSLLTRNIKGVAGTAAQVGMSIVQSKSGEISVNIPKGYTFYIMEDRR